MSLVFAYFFTLHSYFCKNKSPACHWIYRNDVTKRRLMTPVTPFVCEGKQIPLHKRRILQIPYTSIIFAAIHLKLQPF